MIEKASLTLFEKYQLLVEITCELSSTHNLDELLKRIVHAAADLSGVEAASILLYDENRNQLHFQSSTNLDTPLMRGLIVPVEGSLAGEIVRTRKPLIVNNTDDDPRHFDLVGKVAKFDTRSLLGVPMITKQKVVGVLEAVNKLEGNFTEEDLAILNALGSQAGVAIQNVQLYQQSDLISEMVHELRTPLQSLSTAAHLIARPDISDKQQQKIIETIQSETNRLTNMTSTFLDVALLESGRHQFKIKKIEIGELLEEVAELTRSSMEDKGIRLEMKIETPMPRVYGDTDKLKQVIFNLLSNATKYNQPGGINTINAYSTDTEVIFSVRDTGIGIERQHLPSLFTKFYRVPGADRWAKGTGLGLSISKKIVDAHGGTISVDSEAGKGTLFTVKLPRIK